MKVEVVVERLRIDILRRLSHIDRGVAEAQASRGPAIAERFDCEAIDEQPRGVSKVEDQDREPAAHFFGHPAAVERVAVQPASRLSAG